MDPVCLHAVCRPSSKLVPGGVGLGGSLALFGGRAAPLEYALKFGDRDVFFSLPEPLAGNPLPVSHRGRLISQDLANSALETEAVNRVLDGATPRSILEVGAGYGRTAYTLLSIFPEATYTVVDIEPAISISRWYLAQLFPPERLRFVDPSEVDDLETASIDLVVSISSLQEMTPGQVLGYLDLMDRVAAGGRVYLKQWAEWPTGRPVLAELAARGQTLLAGLPVDDGRQHHEPRHRPAVGRARHRRLQHGRAAARRPGRAGGDGAQHPALVRPRGHRPRRPAARAAARGGPGRADGDAARRAGRGRGHHDRPGDPAPLRPHPGGAAGRPLPRGVGPGRPGRRGARRPRARERPRNARSATPTTATSTCSGTRSARARRRG